MSKIVWDKLSRRKVWIAPSAFILLVLGLMALVVYTVPFWEAKAKEGSLVPRVLVSGESTSGDFSQTTKDEKNLLPAEKLWIPPALASETVLLVEREHGTILYEKNSTQQIYPASMTKLMTALVVLDSGLRMEEPVVLSSDIFEHLVAENAALAGFLPGDTVLAKDLLYGMLVPSGAEATQALVEKVSDTPEDFVDQMNKKAQTLGLWDTHFVNATGLHHQEHYTTPEDLVRLFAYVVEQPQLLEIVSTPYHTTQGSKFQPEGILLESTLFGKLQREHCLGAQYILAGKTGYTQAAGQCLVSLGQVQGKEYIALVAGAPGFKQSQPTHLLDTGALFQSLAESHWLENETP